MGKETVMVENFLDPVIKLTQDIKKAIQNLTPHEVRYLVDLYYQVQEYRKSAANQVRSAPDEPNVMLTFVFDNMRRLESRIKQAMDIYSDTQVIGQWSKSIHGIGPVLAAGLMAHIDISKASTVGKIWRFAGLDPMIKWEKGQKRPWNARLKTLCWKISDSFVKVSNSEKDFYGKFYRERKQFDITRNENGELASQAQAALEAKKYRKDTVAKKAYESGILPDGHIDMRARRYAVKMFLSHWHWVAYESTYQRKPPYPWIIEHGGHRDLIVPPNWPMK